jgi:hypothetical protein
MLKACGVIEACSPRGRVYSGKLRARAIELYLDGVKSGYIGWHDLQSILYKEFPSEFPKVADDLPSPETVLEWVRKYPDAPERLRDLRVQQATPSQSVPWVPVYPPTWGPRPALAVPNAGVISWDISALFTQFTAVVAVAIMAHCVSSWIAD